MTVIGDQETTYAAPRAVWVLAWSSLVGQLVALADRGVTDGDSALVSVPLSALVVAWVSAGVIRGRMVRTVLAGVILAVIALASVVGLLVDPSALGLLEAVLASVSLAAYVAHVRNPVVARLQADRRAEPAGLAGLVALAILVGGLGGLTAPVPDDGPGFHVRISV